MRHARKHDPWRAYHAAARASARFTSCGRSLHVSALFLDAHESSPLHHGIQNTMQHAVAPGAYATAGSGSGKRGMRHQTAPTCCLATFYLLNPKP